MRSVVVVVVVVVMVVALVVMERGELLWEEKTEE